MPATPATPAMPVSPPPGDRAARPLAELEVQLVARRAERRRRAARLLADDGHGLGRRAAWGLALVTGWWLTSMLVIGPGEAHATHLGLTRDGLNLGVGVVFVLLVLGYHVVRLERKVKALAELLQDGAGPAR